MKTYILSDQVIEQNVLLIIFSMAVSDVANVLSTARWSEDAFYLKEFVHKLKLPQIGKVIIQVVIANSCETLMLTFSG